MVSQVPTQLAREAKAETARQRGRVQAPIAGDETAFTCAATLAREPAEESYLEPATALAETCAAKPNTGKPCVHTSVATIARETACEAADDAELAKAGEKISSFAALFFANLLHCQYRTGPC